MKQIRLCLEAVKQINDVVKQIMDEYFINICVRHSLRRLASMTCWIPRVN